MHLGRTQLGRELPLSVTTHDQFGRPVLPAAAPTVKILKSTGAVLLSLQIPAIDRFNRKGMFAHSILLDSRFKTGRYFVIYSWTAGSYAGRMVDTVDIIGGGNSSGHVQSAHWMAQPHASFIYFQTSDGVVRKGRGPSVVV